MMDIEFNGKILNFSNPRIMGILNVTPDSFYDGNKYLTLPKALERVGEMVDEGASIIDIGGMSSRPGSEFISEVEEQKRVLPILEAVRSEYKYVFISVDTFRSKVALESIKLGADIINDISAGQLDEGILKVVANYDVPYIFMHMQGIPKNMQNNPKYTNVVAEVLKYLMQKIRLFKSKGINKLIADPGFGFGKSIEDNFSLLKNLDVFQLLEIPVLAGISRKSMLYKTLGISPDKSLNATTVANTIALVNGANILRVHDVKQAMEAVKLINTLSL